jgi:sialidase-1
MNTERVLACLLVLGSVVAAEDRKKAGNVQSAQPQASSEERLRFRASSQTEHPLTAAERERCLLILRAGLASDEFWPAMHAAEALTLAGQGPDVVAALKDRLPKESHDQRRCGLARELVRAGDRSSLAVLPQLLNQEGSIGRVHAAESLYKLGLASDDPGLTAAMVQSENVPFRLMAAAALARSGSRPAMDLLRQTLQSDDRLARNTACFALARLGDASDLPALRTRFAAETDPLARANLINALACLGDPQGRKDLAISLASADAGIRATAAEHVGHARAVEHRPRLIELLDDAGLDVRIRAAQSLIALSLPPVDWRPR